MYAARYRQVDRYKWTSPQMNWMDELKGNVTHCDTTIRANYALSLEPPGAYSELLWHSTGHVLSSWKTDSSSYSSP